MQPSYVKTKRSKANYGNGLAVRDDGVLCPATERILAQPNMKRWDGPMTPEYIGPSPEALQNRLRHLDGHTATKKRIAEVAAGNPFDVEHAGKDEILEFIFDEFGERIDARQNIQTVRKQARDIIAANKQAA